MSRCFSISNLHIYGLAVKRSLTHPVRDAPCSVGANWTAEEKQEHHEQAVLRAQFVQGLVLSTLLKDS